MGLMEGFGGETDHDESLVPVPANSYLGRHESR